MFVIFLAPPRAGQKRGQSCTTVTTTGTSWKNRHYVSLESKHCASGRSHVVGVLGFIGPTLKHFPACGIKLCFECVTAIFLIQSVSHRPQSVTPRLCQ